jgi:hypothetical protein
VREHISYNPETGLFKWRIDVNNKVHAGDIAGVKRGNGYIHIGFGYRLYSAHRLAWEYAHGEIPEGMQIDHINGIRDDNRIENLRLATPTVNRQNLRKALSNSSSGFLGVSPSRGKWRSRIKVSGKFIHLGVYNTPEEAHEAYLVAKRQLHEGNTL